MDTPTSTSVSISSVTIPIPYVHLYFICLIFRTLSFQVHIWCLQGIEGKGQEHQKRIDYLREKRSINSCVFKNLASMDTFISLFITSITIFSLVSAYRHHLNENPEQNTPFLGLLFPSSYRSHLCFLLG